MISMCKFGLYIMKAAKIMILFLGLFAQSIDLFAFGTGDTLFVWARNGLKIKESPNTSSKVVCNIPFGTPITIKEKTDFTFNMVEVKGAKPTEYSMKTDPIILYGNWVKIVTSSGKTGYTIDQYYRKEKPYSLKCNNYSGLNLEVRSIDTSYISPIRFDGDGLNLIIKKKYEHGIENEERLGGCWWSSTYELPNFSVSETLVLFGCSYHAYKEFYVKKNWPDELFIIHDTIWIKIEKRGNSTFAIITESN